MLSPSISGKRLYDLQRGYSRCIVALLGTAYSASLLSCEQAHAHYEPHNAPVNIRLRAVVSVNSDGS